MSRFNILQADVDGIYVLKFVGEIRLNLCSTLERVVDTMLSDPEFRAVVIDLTETDVVDSTTLGLLAKIAVAAAEHNGIVPTIISTNDDVTRIIRSMGFDKIFIILGEPVQKIEELQEIPVLDSTEGEVRESVIDAHRVLMSLNSENQKEFKDLVEALENEARCD
ncbi:MAG: anti-anti-sigma factor [Proteobacteria bacterium]|nr:MAG: anti-anti-sigma factor [Pseudomonadota bacterium]